MLLFICDSGKWESCATTGFTSFSLYRRVNWEHILHSLPPNSENITFQKASYLLTNSYQNHFLFPSPSVSMNPGQRTAMFHYWLSAVEVVLFMSLSHISIYLIFWPVDILSLLFALNDPVVVIVPEHVELLSSKPHPLSFTVFSFQRTEGTGRQDGLCGCDSEFVSSAVSESNTFLICYHSGSYSSRVWWGYCLCHFPTGSALKAITYWTCQQRKKKSCHLLRLCCRFYTHYFLTLQYFCNSTILKAENWNRKCHCLSYCLWSIHTKYKIFLLTGCMGGVGAECGGTRSDPLQSPAAQKSAAGSKDGGRERVVCFNRWARQQGLSPVSSVDLGIIRIIIIYINKK